MRWPCFEEEDAAVAETQALSPDYERRVQALLEAVEVAVQSTSRVEAIPTLKMRVDDLADWVTGRGLAPYFPRELRDLDGAREKQALCARLMTEPR